MELDRLHKGKEMKFTLSRLLLIVFYAVVALWVCNLLGVPDFRMVKEVSVDGYFHTTTSFSVGGIITLVLCTIVVGLAVVFALVLLASGLERVWDWTAYGEWHVSSDPYEWSAGDLAAFNILALGTRFKYNHVSIPDDVEDTWVKISHTGIAKWDDDEVITNWVGQQICSFADNDDEISLSEKVILVEQ
jgi:hypothetical protein